MEKRDKLKALIKNQENSISFVGGELSNLRENHAAISNIAFVTDRLRKLIGGLTAYNNCLELFDFEGLKFTKDLPNKEGWYWIQQKSGLKAVKRVFLNHNDDLCAWVTDPYGKCAIRPIEIFKKAQWAGPIEPPTV